jgi:hypothetical protein
MILAQIDCLRVQYDESLCLLRYQWRGGNQVHSFAQAMTYLADLMQTHQIMRVLVDLDGLSVLSVRELQRMNVSWFPREVVQAIRQVAVVLPTSAAYNQAVVENILTLGSHLTRFNVQFFADPSTALEWLTTSPMHMLALTAEWQAAS